jgi:hypothetical protein
MCVINTSHTVESWDVNMESQDLEPAALELKVDIEPNTAMSEVAMSDTAAIVPATSDNNVSILKSMRAQLYSIYGEVYNKVNHNQI